MKREREERGNGSDIVMRSEDHRRFGVSPLDWGEREAEVERGVGGREGGGCQ